jgi:hypothetical protein
MRLTDRKLMNLRVIREMILALSGGGQAILSSSVVRPEANL